MGLRLGSTHILSPLQRKLVYLLGSTAPLGDRIHDAGRFGWPIPLGGCGMGTAPASRSKRLTSELASSRQQSELVFDRAECRRKNEDAG